MKNKIKIEKIRKKVPLIDGYLNGLTPDQIPEIYIHWIEISNKFNEFIDNDSIDKVSLSAIADVLCRKRKEDLALLKHSRKEKTDYKGAKEFRQLLNDYHEGKIVIASICFDYKKTHDKNNKRKKASDLKSDSATPFRFKGRKVIEGMINTLQVGQIDRQLKAFEDFETNPVFKKGEYPIKKSLFIAKYNRIATQEISDFLKKHKDISERDKKIYAMKTLVHIKFLDSYETYKKSAKAKKVVRIMTENEYYLQRYSEFMRKK